MSRAPSRGLVTPPPTWLRLLERRSGARLALGQAGHGLPSVAQLQFGLDHARARDAVHCPLDVVGIWSGLEALGIIPAVVSSMAPDRQTYLRRPDLGRQLAEAEISRLATRADRPQLAVVIADGLSAQAVNANAVPLLTQMLSENMQMAGSIQVVLGRQCRVAAGDRIATALGARAVLVLIGERPGLSSAHSMGAYLTWNPSAQTTDADRNCISNIRSGGLSTASAAAQLAQLMAAACRSGRTGVGLKAQTGPLRHDSNAEPKQLASDGPSNSPDNDLPPM